MLCSERISYRQPLSDASQTAADLAPIRDYLSDEHIQNINTNSTTVKPATVQAHVEDIYTPGDRLDKGKPRKTPQKRQAPRSRGFPCDHGGCDKVFDRRCELK